MRLSERIKDGMRLSVFFTLMALFIPYSEAQRQSTSASGVSKNSVQVDLPTSQCEYRPKILLQAGLKIAESYITAEHINPNSVNCFLFARVSLDS